MVAASRSRFVARAANQLLVRSHGHLATGPLPTLVQQRSLSMSSKRASLMTKHFGKDSAPPLAGVPYSPAIKANGLVWVSGQSHATPEGVYEPGLSVTEKTHRMCQNARAVLEAAGSSLEKVVKVNVIFLRVDRDYEEFNKVYAEYFPHSPARTSIEVAGLPAQAELEIELVALA